MNVLTLIARASVNDGCKQTFTGRSTTATILTALQVPKTHALLATQSVGLLVLRLASLGRAFLAILANPYDLDGYAPSWDFNLFFTIAFAVSGAVFVVQAIVWPKWRIFSLTCALGSFTEVGGYVGRLLLHNDPFSDMGFKLNVVLLTIAPAFVSAAIYLTLKKATLVFGQRYSLLPPAYYAYAFVACDIVSIILQGAGGAISAVAEDKDLLDDGVNIMIAGLAFQVFTLLVFLYLAIAFVLNCFKNRTNLNPGSTVLAKSTRFQIFVAAVSLSFLCVLTRCCYRAAELSGGWGNEIMRKESEFIIMDSDMCTIAFVCLNIFHPGYLFKDTQQTDLVSPRQNMEMRSRDAVNSGSARKAPSRRQATVIDGKGRYPSTQPSLRRNDNRI